MLILLFLLLPGSAVSLSHSDEKLANGFMKQKGLKILHQNVRGLLCNLPLIQKLLHTHHQTDIFCCSETHIKENEDINNLYTIEGYDFVSRNRTNGSGGGVGIYVKNQLQWKRRGDLENDSNEGIWLEIFLKHTKSFLIACYYRPPNASKYLSSDFNTAFNDTLKLSQKKHKEVIILGDFNANYLKKDDNKELKTIIDINSFEKMIDQPTRITKETEKLIDIALTNNPSSISYVIVDSISIGDHELIGCVRKMQNIKYESKTVRSRDYKNYVPEDLIAETRHTEWDVLYQCNDVNTAANIFTASLKKHLRSTCPDSNQDCQREAFAMASARHQTVD